MDEENVFPKGQSYSIDNDAMTRLQRPDMQFRSRYVHCQHIFYKAPGSRNRHTQVLALGHIWQNALETNSYFQLDYKSALRARPRCARMDSTSGLTSSTPMVRTHTLDPTPDAPRS